MKTVAAVFADFEQTFLGGPSQLRRDLAGRSVLQRTLSRLMRVAGLERRCLFVRPRDQAPADSAVRELGLAGEVDVLPLDDGHRPRRELVRAARKWNLDAWRGSPLGTTWFDEYVEPLCVARVMDHYQCEGVLCLDGHQPVLDVEITATMLAQQHEYFGEADQVFTQAPPGLAGVVLRRRIVRDLLEQSIPLGLLLSYRPEIPRGDPINQPICAQIDPDVAHTAARLTADTRRSRELLSAALTELGDDAGAGEVCAWFRQAEGDRVGSLPLEVELELTTDHPLPASMLRPPADRIPARHLEDLDAVERVARELAAYDDRAIFIGGHGDPLAHPQFAEVCRRIRAAGVCGLAVGTPLVDLSDENLAALLEQRVDVLEVYLDADSSATYRRVHHADRFARVIENVERIERLRRERLSPQPIVVCSMTRCEATLPEMESFYDRWIRATGWALIRGHDEYCGSLPSDKLLHCSPAVRGPCVRLQTRLMLLADGAAAACSQDFRGVQVVGDWVSQPVSEIWRGAALKAVRQAQARLDLDEIPLCGACREWFRP